MAATTDVYARLAYDDENAAADWLARVFGLSEVSRKDGLVWMEISGGTVMVCRAAYGLQTPKALGGISTRMNVYVPDVDAHYERAMAGGATLERDIETMPWGERRYECRDLAGHWWHFAQRDVSA